VGQCVTHAKRPQDSRCAVEKWLKGTHAGIAAWGHSGQHSRQTGFETISEIDGCRKQHSSDRADYKESPWFDGEGKKGIATARKQNGDTHACRRPYPHGKSTN